jgi:hypothetical protein
MLMAQAAGTKEVLTNLDPKRGYEACQNGNGATIVRA